jgi:hypothetical protein
MAPVGLFGFVIPSEGFDAPYRIVIKSVVEGSAVCRWRRVISLRDEQQIAPLRLKPPVGMTIWKETLTGALGPSSIRREGE